MHKITEGKRKIVLFQDNHQFSIHKGSVNSIIFSPNLIYAASDLEKFFLQDNLLFDEEKIISCGWFFKKNSIAQGEKRIENKNNRLLRAFSAPPRITLLSEESYSARTKIILWTTENFPNHEILIKLHPHEDTQMFETFLKQLNVNCKLLPSLSSIDEVIASSNVVLCSNESQIPLDVISTDVNKRLFVYYFKKQNFLVDESLTSEKLLLDDGKELSVCEINEAKKEKINELYLSLNENSIDFARNKLINLANTTIASDSELEILLWLFVYGDKMPLFDYLRSSNLTKHKNLLNVMLNEDFSLEGLNSDFQDPRIKDPLCLILIRYYLDSKTISAHEIELIVKDFFNLYLFQFFFRDFIRFHNLLHAQGNLLYLSDQYINLASKIQELYVSNLRVFILFFNTLQKLYSLQFRRLSSLMLLISDKILSFK